MSKSKAKPYLITYDISDKRRLQRVHRLLKSQAIAMQYSVFISVMNKAECQELTEALTALINVKEDDVRLYPLPQKPEWYSWGDALWPDGMTISGVALPDHYH
jgi:CRISPR-associated protein Cas2